MCTVVQPTSAFYHISGSLGSSVYCIDWKSERISHRDTDSKLQLIFIYLILINESFPGKLLIFIFFFFQFFNCSAEETARMERRERDKLARAMMSQTQNEEPEPLFSAPVRVSEFVDFIDCFCCASSLARRKYEIAILIIVAVRFCSQSDGTFPFFVVKNQKMIQYYLLQSN